MRYQARAVPTIGEVVSGRPAYLPRAELAQRAAHPTGWRRRWKLGGTVTALELEGAVIARALEDWGSRAELERAIDWWTARHFRAAGPAGLCRQIAPEWYAPSRWSDEGPFRPYVRGGWEEATERGILPGPHRLLDLRRAYRWALTAGWFPDRRTMKIARRWTPELPGVHLLELRDPWAAAPWPARKGGTVLVETPIEPDSFPPMPGFRWAGGVTWLDEVSAQPFADRLDEVGVAALQRAYWGQWLCCTAVICEHHATGTRQQLKARGTDAIRAHLITARVRRRMAGVRTSYRFVDSIIVPDSDAPTTGDAIGEWREVKRYAHGVWIGYPGAYGPADGPPDKQAGLAREVA